MWQLWSIHRVWLLWRHHGRQFLIDKMTGFSAFLLCVEVVVVAATTRIYEELTGSTFCVVIIARKEVVTISKLRVEQTVVVDWWWCRRCLGRGCPWFVMETLLIGRTTL